MPGRLSTDVGGLRGKVKRCACIETGLSDLAGSEETLTGCIESSVEGNQKLKSTLGQNLCLSVLSDFAVDFQANSHGSGSERQDRGSRISFILRTALRLLRRVITTNHMLRKDRPWTLTFACLRAA
jgi:hypothetical protein